MAAGRATVLAIHGVIRQVIEAAQAGVFAAPGDPATEAEAVLQLQRDPQSARQMRQRRRAYAVEQFSRHQQAAAFVRLLEGLRPPSLPGPPPHQAHRKPTKEAWSPHHVHPL